MGSSLLRRYCRPPTARPTPLPLDPTYVQYVPHFTHFKNSFQQISLNINKFYEVTVLSNDKSNKIRVTKTSSLQNRLFSFHF